MELNRMFNDKNAQSSPKEGKAAAHVYTLSRAEARKRRPEGVNRVFIIFPWSLGKKKKKRLSSNHERRKEAGQVIFHDVLFTLDA